MKSLFVVLGLTLACCGASAQHSFPISQKEDKEQIMSEAYWKIWNPSVQKQIDRDIEKYRKANGVIYLKNEAAGTSLQIKQVSHDFVFGASMFNFNQLGTPTANQRYKELFGTLFNRATVPFYWEPFEMQPGRPRFREEYWDIFNPQQCLDIAAGKEIQTPQQVWKVMNNLAETGLPIHLSEITITSPGNDTKGQQIQAVIAQNLYRLWFCCKNMMGITWWNIVDDCGAPGEPSVSGLFHRDMSPKLSFYALDNLINHVWKTETSTKAGKNGEVKFRGFRGQYEITYTDKAGKERTVTYHLK